MCSRSASAIYFGANFVKMSERRKNAGRLLGDVPQHARQRSRQNRQRGQGREATQMKNNKDDFNFKT